MGQRSIALVRREFDLNVVADRYADLYRKLVFTGRRSEEPTVLSRDIHEDRRVSQHSGKVP